MRKIHHTKLLACTALTILALFPAACSPVTAQRGNLLEDFQIEQIKPQKNTRSDVLRTLGSPTAKAPFDDNIWYYIGQETEKRGILDPEVVKERIIIVAFNEEGEVTHIEEAQDGRTDIPLSRDKTATYGNDLSAVQQILGNLGRFNPQEQ